MGGDSRGDTAKASVGDGHTRRVLHRLLAVPELPVPIAFPFSRGVYEQLSEIRDEAITLMSILDLSS